MKFCENLGVTSVHADRHMDMIPLMLSACDVPAKYDGSVLSSIAQILCFSYWNAGFENWAQNMEGSCM